MNQLVTRLKLSRDDAGIFVGDRAANELDREFLTSRDQWFRPVQARTGPDGALYIVDMYRYVIEHPRWIPDETKAELDVFAGRGLGRIYRVVRRDEPPTKVPRLDRLSDVELAQLMNSDNGPVRDLVQQELSWRGADGRDVDAALEAVARQAESTAARIQAMAMLTLRGNLPEDIPTMLLANSGSEAIRAVIRLSEELLTRSASFRQKVLALAQSAPVEVRTQIAFSLAGVPDNELVPAIADLAADADNDWLQYAIVTSLTPRTACEFWKLASERIGQPLPLSMCESLIKIAAADQDTANQIAERVLAEGGEANPVRCWQLLSQWLQDCELAEDRVSKLRPKIEAECERATDALRAEAADDPTRIEAMELLVDSSRPATSSLKRVLSRQDVDLIASLLGIQHSPAVQSAALEALANLTPPDDSPLFFPYWESATPALRTEMLDQMLSRTGWIRELLDAIIDNRLRPSDLNSTQRQQISSLDQPELVKLSQKAFASIDTGSRSDVLTQWQDVLKLTGSVEKGRLVFAKNCAACHVLDGAGFNVGPDLAALTSRTAAAFFVAVLDPNREVDGRYLNYTALTVEGQTYSGVLTEETAVSVTLKEREGKTHVLLRRDLDELRASKLSAMPEGVEKDFSHQDLADLIAYLIPPRNKTGSSGDESSK